ncbi:ABC transporter permease [Iamia sp. SCSIO 61187]|uniref:ABC transporter permease n=1 Tax=Iamia sp. SCSIO 61187 TaxID=2722752 RepID=UPI001C634B08|nr:ABC transporter permease [Iamia sp. SCSIO 61187]QYG94512.1 ABC transporter permease [Iamia sp. SCSIO 61187]
MSAPETTQGRVGRWALNAYAVLGFVYLFVPIAVIVAFSFNQPAGKFNIVWQSFTLDNWADPFAPGPLMDAMVVSIKIALVAAGGSTVLGTLIALALVRYRFKGGKIVDLLLVLPLTAPEIVLGASLLSLFLDAGVQRGFWTIAIAHVLFCTSFVALTVKARIRGFDWTLEDAAMDLGAPPWRTFRKVTLPLITPGIIAAALLSFALSIDDFIITFFNAGSTETFPLRIFGASRTEISPQINVLATVILLASVGVMVAGVALRAAIEGRTLRRSKRQA